ncbi:MAG TPA: hypothetical protein VGD45_14430 [Steroidobacter sp.]|uniref:hypothetical protein n=1 Tax=Steroidobacter sp. TaxID=1978227 RepID=UPI002ED80F8B
MRISALSVMLAWAVAGGAVADEIEPLDGAFLEYLANLEAEDGDWTLVAPPEADEAEPTENSKDKPAGKAPTKQTAKPAVEDR